MIIIANIIWFIFIGLFSCISYILEGLLFCLSIIGIPFGLQAFKFAQLVLMPFGKEVKTNMAAHPIANLIWLIFGGLIDAFCFYFFGLILYITIIGIPLGKQAFKMGQLSLAPFGAVIK